MLGRLAGPSAGRWRHAAATPVRCGLLGRFTAQNHIKLAPRRLVCTAAPPKREDEPAPPEARDPRIWPLSATMMLSGTAVGVVLPVMPLLVGQLGLSEAQFGIAVSAFGLAKLLGNVPSAVLVDRLGRRPTLVGGLVVISAGFIAVGSTTSLEGLIFARFLTGLGVSALISGAVMAAADISTARNRASMMAPLMAAFNAGTVLGPAIGGVCAGAVGVSHTFHVVAAAFAANAAASHAVVAETMPAHVAKAARAQSLGAALASSVGEWAPLIRAIPMMRALLLLNGAYWGALAGANMTLLPLMLAGDTFGLSAPQIGGVFALQSIVSVRVPGPDQPAVYASATCLCSASAPPAHSRRVAQVLLAAPCASLADRVGPTRVLAPALGLSSAAMLAFAASSDILQASCAIALWSVGGTLLGSAPTAAAANLAAPEQRSQALALMRTAGDVGLLCGASSVGYVATMVGCEAAMGGTAVFLLSSAGLFVLRAPRI